MRKCETSFSTEFANTMLLLLLFYFYVGGMRISVRKIRKEWMENTQLSMILAYGSSLEKLRYDCGGQMKE